MRRILDRLEIDWDLDVIEGGDHSFNLLKSAGIPQQEVYGRILGKMVDWLQTKTVG